MGHEDQFPPPSSREHCGFRERTFAGTHAKGRDAPFPDLPVRTPNGEVRPEAAIRLSYSITSSARSASNWWTLLLSSGGSGKVSNGPGTALFYG